MRKILITGITGFIGSNFTHRWRKDHTLYGLDIKQPYIEGVESVYSWNDLEKVPSVDAIVHLAGKAHDTDNKSDAQSYFEVNTGLTQKVFDWFLESDATTFVFFSSVKAAADVVHADILTEDVVPAPVGAYGESKIRAEEYILSKKDECDQKGKHVYILRPCMIHGPGNKGNLNSLYSLIKKGIPWPLGAFDNKRSFCSIDNIMYVVEQLILRADVESGIYQVCDDTPLSTNQLIETMCKAMGKKPSIWKLPKGIINSVASLGSILHLPLNKFTLQKLTENYVVSNAKIKSALGIDKLPVSAEEGITNTIQSFKNKK